MDGVFFGSFRVVEIESIISSMHDVFVELCPNTCALERVADDNFEVSELVNLAW